MKRASFVGILAFTLLNLACSDNDPPTGPTTGSITVTVTTTGDDAPTGYTVSLDGSTTRSVDANGSETFASVSTGGHSIELTDVPANCTMTGANPANVTVAAGATTPVAMNLICSALVGSIDVSVTSTGDDIPTAYTLVLAGETSQTVAANGSVTFTDVPVGSHQMELTDLPASCSVTSGNPATVTVTAGGTTPVAMNVACSVLVGSIEVTVQTEGFDLDPDGYQVSLDGAPPQHIPVQDVRTFADLAAGDHVISITDVRGNCEVVGEDSRIVAVGSGEVAREAFEVTCDWNSRIAFLTDRDGDQEVYVMRPDGSDPINITNYPTADMADHRRMWSADGSRVAFTGTRGSQDIYVVNRDGTGLIQVTTDLATDIMPTWSPAGDQIAFQSSRDGDYEIFIANVDGTGITKVPGGSGEAHPSWSPDGSYIAVRSYRTDGGNSEVFLTSLDGSIAVNLSNHPGFDSDPIWSPDGSRIAFISGRNGTFSTYFDVFVVNADGSGLTNVSNSPDDDRYPVWSPDGSRIAFQSERNGNREIYVVNADGSGLTRVTDDPEDDYTPSWSPDGSQIAFTSNRSGYPQVYVMRSDGTDVTQLTSGPGFSGSPGWSPYRF